MRRLFLLALCLSACSVGARAQTTMDLSTIDLGIQQIQENTFVFNSINQSMAVNSGDSSGRTNSSRTRTGGPTTTGGRAGSPAAAALTTFKPVAPSIMPQRLAAQMGRTPQERDKLEKFFTLLLTDYKELAVKRGAPLNDVARASSFAVGTSYDVYYAGSPLGDKAFQAARRQMYEAMAESPKFRAMGDRERQEMYESYIILGQFVSAAYESANHANDKALADKMHDLARILLEGAFGVPVERLRFTDEGVRF